MGMYCRCGKRILDLMLVLSAILLLWPFLCIIYFLVRWKLGTPVFFRQIRPGFRGRPFELVKFRTMTETKNEQGDCCPDEERLTPFGKFLRTLSLDELPELWNVLKGEMSWVGPRPLLMEYLPLYSPEQARRHDVRPGITGWAQVNGRNAISWNDKFALDVWYVDHVGFLLDCRILWRTIVQVAKRDGISAEGHVTMSKFMGSSQKETKQ